MAYRRGLGRLIGAALLVAAGGLHLDLYLTGYRTIPTIGPLFLLQVVLAWGLAAGVLVSSNRIVSVAGAGFALATLGGYLLSLWSGLFGFKEVRTTAGIVAGGVEVGAFGVLAWLALAGFGAAPHPDRLASAARSAAGAVFVLAAVLLGAALASAPGAAPATAGAEVQLGTRIVGGTLVLTNPGGLTLYWFAKDTSSGSRCYGSCAAYWPPVLGRPAAGAGVVGRLGTVTRKGGALQATYDGHPLYTYVGDTPGTARGNDLNLNGGIWHEATVRG